MGELPPGFQELRPDLPITCYTRRLPHWRQKGATYFFTFHTADALPEAARIELAELRQRWLAWIDAKASEAEVEQLRKRIMQRTDAWLDQGHGRGWFGNLTERQRLHDALLFFHEKRVEVGAFVLMPNHVHGIARPLGDIQLEHWLGGVKQYVSTRVDGKQAGDEHLWFQESYDRIVRDRDHLANCISYMGRNPGPRVGSHVLWLNPEWEALGWRWP